jgi:hypothetical protein
MRILPFKREIRDKKKKVRNKEKKHRQMDGWMDKQTKERVKLKLSLKPDRFQKDRERERNLISRISQNTRPYFLE